MTARITRRGLLRRLGAATGGGMLAPARSFADTRASCAELPPPPVAPVDPKAAARHGIAYKAMPREVVGVDVESLITVNSAADVASKRAGLIAYVWKSPRLPDGSPRVEHGVSAPPLAGLSSAARIDALIVPLKYEMTSRVFHVLARRPNGRLALYHNGHNEPAATMLRTVDGLLGRGYSVLVFAMPFMHWNAQPIADPAVPGKSVTITSHDALVRWESPSFSALTFFLEPVAVALNYAIATYRPSSVQMIGLSGGGWTTTVYAAIDPRITRSYPAAGSLPFHLRPASLNVTSSVGDWEQRRDTLPGFYGIAEYLDLYVMAAAERRRRQLQVLNRFDPCCFSGVGHRDYAAVVSHRTGVIGQGSWDVLEDATHDEHTISPYALSVILHDLDVHRDGL
ncbi:hypothetical protein [Actinomadura sp. DC4]|uniref:hypothetical protein n=1 Tax=Actinomadura sp. DC4 TaxID=3055069 RepID=UPI0025AFA9FC|nr:hypothetical protein [Actinomadura sp. DC4]MDN3353672.1 hypothetical protein [Actinomadura sp. DC4]